MQRRRQLRPLGKGLEQGEKSSSIPVSQWSAHWQEYETVQGMAIQLHPIFMGEDKRPAQSSMRETCHKPSGGLVEENHLAWNHILFGQQLLVKLSTAHLEHAYKYMEPIMPQKNTQPVSGTFIARGRQIQKGRRQYSSGV